MKTKILLVDDEEDLRDIFDQFFWRQIQANTYEFIYAGDGLEALQVLAQHPDIDVVLSDINMPGMDGLTLLAKLSEINAVIRTVIVTAYGDIINIRTAMNRGAFDFLTKPINLQDLELTLEKTIRFVHQLRETTELKAVDEMKSRFFTNITHELRAPLSLIVSPVDQLLETVGLPSPFQQTLTTVQRNARQLLRLINQLLDINKLEAGQMSLVNEIGDLPGYVGQIVDLFRPSATIKQLYLRYETDLPVGPYLFDAGKWEKILYNLLSNAIKFTQTGGITVWLHQHATGAQLTIRDTGIGIDADQLPHIFNRFYQVDNSLSRSHEGTGIGLDLVQALVTRLKGIIQVQSQTGGANESSGTQFLLQIPIQRAGNYPEAPLLPAPSPINNPPSLPTGFAPGADAGLADTTPLLLVVEDNTELREFIVTELSTTYRIRSAANGYEGWVLAKEELPDVIISDLMMPRLDGYELVERLKTDSATDHIAVILLTANASHENRLRGFAHGADEYLTKPFHMGELQLRLRNLLNHQHKLREQYSRQLAQPDASGALESVQDPFLRRLYQLIEQRLDDPSLNVEWLADQLAVSQRTLQRKVHTLTHLSPVDIIRQYRLQKAIELLQNGHNASETAYRVGFDSPSYFSKVFKEAYQQTPTYYLKR